MVLALSLQSSEFGYEIVRCYRHLMRVVLCQLCQKELIMNKLVTLILLSTVAAMAIALPQRAEACGCFSPPIPSDVSDSFAVNQLAEQIIFESHGDGTTTAHVMIKYEGNPDAFAWLLPVVGVPELGLSQSEAFAMLSSLTAPRIEVSTQNICPQPAYECAYHSWPSCDEDFGCGTSADIAAARSTGESTNTVPGGDFGAADAGTKQSQPPVTVLDRQVIGSYETVTFAATDAAAAVNWLKSNNFIVNDTTAPYMQPYLDMGMGFVAAKLVPGAGVEEIRPLKVHYDHPRPMIPLKLTAVAAEPELAVTAFIYSNDALFEPMGGKIVSIDAERLSQDASGRNNYPMLLSRTIDEAGDNSFVEEFAGNAPRTTFASEPCCGEFDQCGVASDTQCQCPNQSWEGDDCSEGIVKSVTLIDELADKYQWLTRLTTRLSPHEMTFDPEFEARSDAPFHNGALFLSNTVKTVAGCEDDVVDQAALSASRLAQNCATTYCGEHGSCVPGQTSGSCECESGYVARRFVDLDGQSSLTCVPSENPVDFGADGLALPDACLGIECGDGNCIDRGGFPSCECAVGAAATLESGALRCVIAPSMPDNMRSPGAEDFSVLFDALDICDPAPPEDCGSFGWLEAKTGRDFVGVQCPSSVLKRPELVENRPPAPSCDDLRAARTGGADRAFSGAPAISDIPVVSGGSCRAGFRGPMGVLPVLGLLFVLRRRLRRE